MKVNSALSHNNEIATKPSKEDIQAKLREKFGKDFGEEKKKALKAEEDVVVSIDSKGKKQVDGEGFGDIKKNDPGSELTQEKLRGLLRTGAFSFSDKERKALDEILN